MNQILSWMVSILALVYGILTMAAGLGQIRAGKIQAWAAYGMAAFGLAVAAGALLSLLGSPLALWVLGLGLLGIHVLAINNGLHMFGKINASHHLARLALSVLLMVLAYLGSR